MILAFGYSKKTSAGETHCTAGGVCYGVRVRHAVVKVTACAKGVAAGFSNTTKTLIQFIPVRRVRVHGMTARRVLRLGDADSDPELPVNNTFIVFNHSSVAEHRVGGGVFIYPCGRN